MEKLIQGQKEWDPPEGISWAAPSPTPTSLRRTPPRRSWFINRMCAPPCKPPGRGSAWPKPICDRRKRRLSGRSKRINFFNSTEQFLEIELPAGAELWTAQVAGESVKPVQDGARTICSGVKIPLVKTAAGDLDYQVVLRLRRQNAGAREYLDRQLSPGAVRERQARVEPSAALRAQGSPLVRFRRHDAAGRRGRSDGGLRVLSNQGSRRIAANRATILQVRPGPCGQQFRSKSAWAF